MSIVPEIIQCHQETNPHDYNRAYAKILDDSPPSFVSTLKSLVYSIKISELLQFPLSLPELPERPSPIASPTHLEVNRTPEIAISVEGGDGEADAVRDSPTPKPSNARSILDKLADDNPSRGPKNPKKLLIIPPTIVQDKVAISSNPFYSVPSEMIVILLTFYDAFNNNPTFSAMVFNDQGQ